MSIDSSGRAIRFPTRERGFTAPLAVLAKHAQILAILKPADALDDKTRDAAMARRSSVDGAGGSRDQSRHHVMLYL